MGFVLRLHSFSILTLFISYFIGSAIYKCIELGDIHAKTIDVSKEGDPILFWSLIFLGGLVCAFLIIISFVRFDGLNEAKDK